ncbi:hypothetical protein BgiMline_027271, partial [Biomphalaria glabrata]
MLFSNVLYLRAALKDPVSIHGTRSNKCGYLVSITNVLRSIKEMGRGGCIA